MLLTENYPEMGVYEHHNFFQTSNEKVCYFIHMSKNNTLRPYITPEGFNTSKTYTARNRLGCNLFVSDIPHHEEFRTPQPEKVKTFPTTCCGCSTINVVDMLFY